MCTAATYKTKDFYFGRHWIMNSLMEMRSPSHREIIYLSFGIMEKLSSHYAIIGMAHVAGDYPLLLRCCQ